jgi:SH3-like domain-containing protein
MALPKRDSTSRSAPSAAPEGGNDVALALTSTIQGQANEMALATQAAAISIDHAAEQLSDIFTQVMSGKALLNATLAKTQEKLAAQGTIQYQTEVPPIALELPRFGSLQETRQGFLGLLGFGGERYSPENPFLSAAAQDADCEGVADE